MAVSPSGYSASDFAGSALHVSPLAPQINAQVQIEGTAEVVTLPEAMEPLVDYDRRLAGEHPDWEDYRRAMTADRRALIRITIERAGPDRQG